MRPLARMLGAVFAPGLGGQVSRFRAAQSAATRGQAVRSVAVVGLEPGEGRSTVVAVAAVAATAFTDLSVTVLDAVAAGGPRPSVTELLGGDPQRAGLARLLPEPGEPGGPVSRAAVRAARTPGAAVPVLGVGPADGPVTATALRAALVRLEQRTDLVLVDTPSVASDPDLFAGVLAVVEHVVVVAGAGADAGHRVAAVRDRIARGPAPLANREVSVVLVDRAGPSLRRGRTDPSATVLRRAAALRDGRIDRMGRGSVVDGLVVVATLLQRAGASGS
ncbi:hypothetical protein [Nakamurella endophytica]|uniref:Uncharacterized protein n=1 Tax=Nakamurella endophytica TaxID=1748367 RepID=A0A917SU96_9ACTN|nr:hypothetical protein [Nakamurella endophytica]GGL96292.1 hypothetical protein GCM10011594_15010 [Nakamurella endophytica]